MQDGCPPHNFSTLHVSSRANRGDAALGCPSQTAATTNLDRLPFSAKMSLKFPMYSGPECQNFVCYIATEKSQHSWSRKPEDDCRPLSAPLGLIQIWV